MMNQIRKTVGPVSLFLLLGGLHVYGGRLLLKFDIQLQAAFLTIGRYMVEAALWLVGTVLLIQFLEFFFWKKIMAPRLGGHVPKLLKDVLAGLLFVLACIGIAGSVFNLPITGLLATSGAIGVVVGLAIQSMIADLFTGMALSVDRPFVVGEWITLHERGLDPITGQVTEISWRSTQIKKTDGVIVVVPNSRMGTAIFTNLSRPESQSRFKMQFSLDFDVPTERGLRILEAALKSAPGVLEKPAAKVRVNGTSQWGVEYEFRYWLDPVATSPSEGRNRISIAVLDHMHHAGLTLAFPKQVAYTAKMPQQHLESAADSKRLLERVELFKTLQPDEFEELASRIKPSVFNALETIVEQSDPGESMFVLVEGLLEVHSTSENGTEVRVGMLTPGHFFGEISLLTGEARSATVRAATNALTYEITKEAILPLLEKRPQLAEDLASAIAERQLASTSAHDKHREEEQIIRSREGLTKSLVRKVRDLFRLG